MSTDEITHIGLSNYGRRRFTTGLGSTQYLEHVQTVDVSEQWITHLMWLPWTSTGENECEL